MSKILQMTAENIKRLKAVEITPNGSIVEITGDNGQGKSSVLDSIIYALGGKEVIQDVPIRRGQETAKIVLQTDRYTITRTFTARGNGEYDTKLHITNEDGANITQAQTLISSWIGDLCFDPLEFVDMQPKDKIEVLKRVVTDFDFVAAERSRKQIFDDRTDINRKIKEAKSAVNGFNLPAEIPQPVDVTALLAELEKRNEHNRNVANERVLFERKLDEAARMEQQSIADRDRAAELERQAKALRETADARDADAQKLRDDYNVDFIETTVDTAEINAKLASAQSVNDLVRRKSDYDALLRKVETLELMSAELTSSIEAIDRSKSEAIQNADLGVDGLGFDETGITLHGLPFDQASSAQQIDAAVKLSMKANPKLKIILIKHGSLVGRRAFEQLREIAEKNDFQIWMETVESSRPGAIVIEEGSVASINTLEAAE